MRTVVPLPLSDIPKEGIEKLTLQVYCPPSDVFSRGNERILLLETTPDELSHSTDGGVTRLIGAVKLHSVEKGLPASDTIIVAPVIFGARGSGEQKILCKVE